MTATALLVTLRRDRVLREAVGSRDAEAYITGGYTARGTCSTQVPCGGTDDSLCKKFPFFGILTQVFFGAYGGSTYGWFDSLQPVVSAGLRYHAGEMMTVEQSSYGGVGKREVVLHTRIMIFTHIASSIDLAHRAT